MAACADACTAAITSDGALWSWGDGASGALGFAHTLRQFIPRQVDTPLRDAHVVQVGSQLCMLVLDEMP